MPSAPAAAVKGCRALVRRCVVAVSLFTLAALAVPHVRAQGPDPFVGEWKLNLEKSRFPGPPPERPHILRFDQQADGSILGLLFDIDARERRTAASRIVFRYDGREYRDLDAGTGAPKSNTLAFTSIDRRTVEVIHRLGDPPRVYKEIRRVSEDGRTMTFSMTASSRQGQTVSVIQVFDRQ